MYKVQIGNKALKQLEALPVKIANKIASTIDALAINPRPQGIKKMQGFENYYRIRVSDYRIIYQIKDNVLTVVIIKIGHRKDIYK
jgi:mRNA interferase RelE/StbE